MKSDIRERMEGRFHKTKGRIKEIAGKLTEDPRMEAEGTGERMAGQVQIKIGQVKKVFKKALKK